MNIQDVSHDDFLAEVRRRLDIGQFGWHGLMSTDQSDYHGMWVELYLYAQHQVQDAGLRGDAAARNIWRDVTSTMEAIVNRKPSPPKLSGINTTRIGREDEL